MAKAGRGNLAFPSPENMEQRIEEYFESLKVFEYVRIKEENGEYHHQQVQTGSKVPGIAGLAAFLGVNRRTILDYAKTREEFSHVVTRAIGRIEAAQEEALVNREGSTRGVEFSLNVNYEWRPGTDHAGEQGSGLELNTITPIANPPAQIEVFREGEED